MKTPQGFTYSGINAGIKSVRKDLALVVSSVPAAGAGCFTLNKARAAPILDVEERLPAEGVRAVVINSGNANAMTGPQGVADVLSVREALADLLHVPASAVLTASTGVIGHPLPLGKIKAGLPKLTAALSPQPEAAAEAILTTDTRVKTASRTIELDGKQVTLYALCKGSGMIAPALATMIAVVTTDCAIRSGPLAAALRAAMGFSFNSLTVDGDMSTNDAVFALANGLAGNTPITDPGPAYDQFAAALADLCQQLAKEIAADGEGATRLLEVTVAGVPTVEMAQDLARSIAGSSLVKAAIFGADPNWGRVLASLGARAGTQGYAVEPAAARVTIQGLTVYDQAPVSGDASALKVRMREPEVKVVVTLPHGEATCTAWGCDLSYDYVKINADYSSLLVQTPEGGVARDDRLANYTPKLKATLLVEALSYISRFTGQRCVIKYGGEAMVKDSLKASFCRDIHLLRSVGLKPIVVHGGGPEVTRTLAQLGSPESALKVREMVLTGSINTELVTLLNQDGGHAIGMSGKDGGLLRAMKLLGEDGRDQGPVGEISRVNHELLEMLLAQGYVPVLSPVGLGEDGGTYDLNADAVAAAVAMSVRASKLIFLSDVAGILKDGELLSELNARELEAQLLAGSFAPALKAKAQAILRAVRGGVERVHVIDGRLPHGLIAELFTDKGIGTLVTA